MFMADDEDVYIPLQHQRAFGSSLKRKRIDFVRAAASVEPKSTPGFATPTSSAEDLYLSIVLPKSKRSSKERASTSRNVEEPSHDSSDPSSAVVLSEAQEEHPDCPICHSPVDSADAAKVPHEVSLAHQICLEHSYPPSAIDRRRKGLSYLESRGWDPDARKGLGAKGEGRLYPVQPKFKQDNSGVGAKTIPRKTIEKPKKLNAGEMQKKDKEDRLKGERLQRIFYGDDKVNRYLGLEL